MIYQKHPTYTKRRKNVHCRFSTSHKLINDAFFYILLIFLLKVKEAQLQSTNNLYEDSSNSTSDFNIFENPSHTARYIPIIEGYATKTASFINTDSNDSVIIGNAKSPVTFRKTISNADILEVAYIEPSDYNSMKNIPSLDLDKSGDSFIGPRIKSTKWVSGADTSSKTENTNSKDKFCSKNSSMISFNGSGINPNESPTTETVDKKTPSNWQDEFFDTKNPPVKIFNSSTTDSDEKSTTTRIYDVSTPDPKDFGGKNTSRIRLNEKIKADNRWYTIEEFKEAEKMTECIPRNFNNGGIVCVCNKTYCDKLLPVIELPTGKFSWYKSSYDGYRFDRVDGQLSQFTKYVKDALIIDTTTKFKTFIGFGGAFSDSASRNIESLSKQTREQLMQSYYGPFGLQYVLGRVPMGGTDFSPRFYTYMDIPKNFMLSEQDLKYKIPVIREAIEITHNKLKLLGCPWTAPKWMKTKCSSFDGELKHEYYQLYADYYVMFLDNYAKNGIKFWAMSTGNRPMVPYNQTGPPFVNAMEWSPYKQSKWVNRYLAPTLKNSGYDHIKLVIGEENLETIAYYAKWFFEPLLDEEYYDIEIYAANEAYHDISGISVHGYGEATDEEIFLDELDNSFPEKFVLLGETACHGKPQLGAWNCAERYAEQMITYFSGLTSGFIDWNLALDQEGGPTYLNDVLDAAIIVDIENDEFYKQPMYYVIGHFSKFLTPDTVQVTLHSYSTGISAIAAQRPDQGIVIVAYNRSPQSQNTVFIIDEMYTITLNISAKSINTVLFWLD